MKNLIWCSLLLGMSTYSIGQTANPAPGALPPHFSGGILQKVENANVTQADNQRIEIRRKSLGAPITITFSDCQALGVQRDQDQWWVLPVSDADTQIHTNAALWVLPLNANSKEHAWDLEWQRGNASAVKTAAGLTVTLDADSVTAYPAEARPHSDVFRHDFSFNIPGGAQFEDALAGFYWGTMLPSVVEKTMAAHFSYSSGYVLSTLNTKAYAGSYPAVDHEFQIKGRLAIGSELDLDIVRRMIELQFQLMHDDPEHLSRSPTSVQPDGRREYHIRRNSYDNRENAAMFPLTGNIEVQEEAWNYFAASKDTAWLRRNIDNLEKAAAWTLQNTDQYGRVWSDVYYEDQVIKDGRVTQAQAFAARSFGLLANMERALGRAGQAAHYSEVSKKLAAVLIQPLPMGYWDDTNHRFVDWVDRNGQVHDHIHLLANTLPVTFGYATPAQAESVKNLVEANEAEFERFPSFLSANIGAYTKSEIGSSPYDLSAAGRYWYWDAAFRASQDQNDLLSRQLLAVAAEAAKDNYYMGERYDMDHVYYIDGQNAHGAVKYYEYPNVFAAVLITKLLGLTIPSDADISVAPHLNGYGSIELRIPEYDLSYRYDDHGFVLKNLSGKRRTFKVDLSSIGADKSSYRLVNGKGSSRVHAPSTVTLAPQEEAHWVK
ncbi:hypothetical protein [Silvibacterium acidisoli]|uniref:hypothetical protein n=1 Tax=Acidobacteriaceae bacterium ZG23-2 TaxID=2883246 RepID=UPI00406C5683